MYASCWGLDPYLLCINQIKHMQPAFIDRRKYFYLYSIKYLHNLNRSCNISCIVRILVRQSLIGKELYVMYCLTLSKDRTYTKKHPQKSVKYLIKSISMLSVGDNLCRIGCILLLSDCAHLADV